jgi:hypothetical protein
MRKTVLGLIFVALFSLVAGVSPAAVYLTWRNDPTTSIVVNWWNPAATGDSFVDYGPTDIYGSTAYVPTVTNYHHVELTGLTPGATYHYRVRSSDGTTGSDNTFTTAEAGIASFCFAVYGDPRGTATADEPYYSRHRALCDWILAQPDIDFVLETGDTVWEGSTSLAMSKYWPDFFEIESNLSKSKVIMATMGGHEVQPLSNSTNYQNFYSEAFPTNGTANNNGMVYSFDYSNAHFICLSSYQINLTTQAAWLEADLIAAKARPNVKWIFVYFHEPMYTTSGHPNREAEIAAWGPIFDQYGVDIVFQCHNHVYERSHPIKAGQVVGEGKGTVYVTCGMGGAEFNNTSPSPLFAAGFGASNLNKTNTACVTINGVRLTVQAITNENGAVIDTFSLTKAPVGDFDKSGTVDINDLGIFSGSWLDTGIWP